MKVNVVILDSADGTVHLFPNQKIPASSSKGMMEDDLQSLINDLTETHGLSDDSDWMQYKKVIKH